MQRQDAELAQIINIIRRGQRLVFQAKREGAEVEMAEELINEARYALKLDKREDAIDYAKKCIVEVVKAKRKMDTKVLQQKGVLEGLTKEELRMKCKELGLDALGLKSELIERVREKLDQMQKDEETRVEEASREPEEEKKIAPRKMAEESPARVEETVDETPKAPAVSETITEWDPVIEAKALTPGLSYLVEEKRPEKFFRLYNALIGMGMKGLVISRTNPRILARTYSLDESESVWLTGKEVQGETKTVLPILEFIMSIYEEYIEQTPDGVILLDGLEYLLTNNKFNSVLRFLRQVVDNVSQTECILMVALSPDALDSTEVTLLEKDLLPLNFLK